MKKGVSGLQNIQLLKWCKEIGVEPLWNFLLGFPGESPDDYRQKWGLPADYPMVAPNYAEQRTAFAKKIGLGRGTGRQAGKRAAPAAVKK